MAANDITGSVRSFFRSLSPMRRITFMVLVGGTIAGLLYIILWSAGEDFQPIYSNLDPADSAAILKKLNEENVPARVSGDTILVPRDRVFDVTMKLASEGLPQGGVVGFEIFDNKKLGMTPFEQDVNYQRALQGELERTMNRLDPVKHSRVHIVMASESLFVEEEKPATASVVLTLKRGKNLSREYVRGIVHLVSASVPGLSPGNVTVLNSSGKLLTGVKGTTPLAQNGSEQLDYQEEIERKLHNRVKTMLDEVLGPNKTIVRLSCLIDFKHQEKTEERYDPANQVVRSEQIKNSSSTGAGSTAGVPGVLSNMTGAGGGASSSAGGMSSSRKEQVSNYEIGKTVRHVVEPYGEIERITVSVIVDGIYRPVKEKIRGKRKTGMKRIEYVPRSEQELAEIEKIVKGAINFKEGRDDIEVVNIRFDKGEEIGTPVSTETGFGIGDILALLKLILMIIAVVFLFIFVGLPLVRWVTRETSREGRILRQLPMTVGELEKEYGAKGRPISYSEQVVQSVDEDVDRAVRIMRELMKQR